MKERRKCRRFIPLIYLGLEILGVTEGVLFGYFLFGQNKVYASISLGIAFALVLVSISKTMDVYKTRCEYKTIGGIHGKKRIRVNKQTPGHH